MPEENKISERLWNNAEMTRTILLTYKYGSFIYISPAHAHNSLNGIVMLHSNEYNAQRHRIVQMNNRTLPRVTCVGKYLDPYVVHDNNESRSVKTLLKLPQ